MENSSPQARDLEQVPVEYLRRTLFLELELNRLGRVLRKRTKGASSQTKRWAGTKRSKTKRMRRS